MGQKRDFSDDIKRINEIEDPQERAVAFQRLDEEKRRFIGGYRGWRIKLGLMSKKTTSLNPNPIAVEHAEGYAGDVTHMNCKLNSAKPKNPGKSFKTFRILSVERL